VWGEEELVEDMVVVVVVVVAVLGEGLGLVGLDNG